MLLTAIYQTISTDAFITYRIASYAGLPAVFTAPPPSDVFGPYINIIQAPLQNIKANPRLLTAQGNQVYIDIHRNRTASMVLLNEISDRVLDLLHKTYLFEGDWVGIAESRGDTYFSDKEGIAGIRRIINIDIWKETV
jgi:hypothetical protein